MAERRRPVPRQGSRARSNRRRLSCTLRGDRLEFRERVDGTAARDAFRSIAIARKKGQQGLTLDFSTVERAYPEGMIQIISLAESLRKEDVHFDVILPQDRQLARIFEGNNWAHFISPLLHEPTASTLERHLPLRRYHTGEEQRAVVDDSLELLLHRIKVKREILHALEWSLNEITDNVLVHAEAPEGGLVQVTTFREQRRVQLVVADGGRGILSSMQEVMPDLSRDTDAIGEAMKQGVTRSPDVGQGNGLAGALRIATGSSGSLAVLSGHGEVKVIMPPGTTEHEHKTYRRRDDERFAGTMVFVEVMVDKLVNLDEALDFGGGGAVDWDYIDAKYGDGNEDIVLAVADEAVGFGTRSAGESFRTKLDNLLSAKPGSRIILDWAGVPLVSSSFADEVLGKLFVEMGPVTFSSRVRSTGMEPLVRKISDRAIMQRVAQSGAHSRG